MHTYSALVAALTLTNDATISDIEALSDELYSVLPLPYAVLKLGI